MDWCKRNKNSSYTKSISALNPQIYY